MNSLNVIITSLNNVNLSKISNFQGLECECLKVVLMKSLLKTVNHSYKLIINIKNWCNLKVLS